MARLIDADALYEVVSEHVTTVSVCPTVDWARGKSQMKEICLEDIANAPTVDAMPVVRCKNCKYWEPDQAPLDEIVDNHPCQYYNVWRAPDDYCSCGEAIDDTPTCGSDYCEIGGDGHADG